MMAARQDPGFFIVGIDVVLWEEYCSWFTARKVEPPPYVSDCIFVVSGHGTQKQTFVAGCCVYPCDGPYAFAEHLATNPGAPVRLRHGASAYLMRQLSAYGAMRKKTMLAMALPGMAKMCRKAGFKDVAVAVLVHGPWSEK
jgi:hypothetical protein